MADVSGGFLKLPPEIRNKIYASLVTDGDWVQIEETPERRVTIRGYCKKVDLHRLGHLLRSCTQLRSELAPILYGVVEYRFMFFYELVSWLATIGPMIHHVRKISILQWNVADARRALSRLEAARNLTSFKLEEKVRRKPAPMVALAFAPLIEALKKSKTGVDGKEKASGVVYAIPDQTILRWRSEPEVAEELKAVEDYNSALHVEWKKLLA